MLVEVAPSTGAAVPSAAATTAAAARGWRSLMRAILSTVGGSLRIQGCRTAVDPCGCPPFGVVALGQFRHPIRRGVQPLPGACVGIPGEGFSSCRSELARARHEVDVRGFGAHVAQERGLVVLAPK